MRIIIIGGVAGGATAAARIRRLTEEAEILLIEKGKYISHANCGLSVDLTYEDLGGAAFKIGSVTFRCNAEIKDGETMYSEDVSVSF